MTERDGMEKDGGRGFMSDLAAELTLLRKGMEEIFELLDKKRFPPDHGERIGELARAVTAATERIERIEASEALKRTPEAHAKMIQQAADGVAAQGRENVQEACRRLSSATAEIKGAAGQARHPYDQKVRNRWFALGGVVVSAVLWFLVTAYVLDPAYSIWPYRVTSDDTLKTVGWHFVEKHDPEVYGWVLKADALYKRNSDAFAACEDAARTHGTSVECRIVVQVPK